MVKFTGAYPLDYIYMKARKMPIAVSVPLCEVFNGRLVKEKLTEEEVVLVSGEKNEEWVFSRDEFKAMLKRNLEKWQTPFVGEVVDMALQPEGETMSEEVFHFFEKYDK